MISFVLALIALIIAATHAARRGRKIPLWVAIALLALAMMIPWLLTLSAR